jgi:hypothetical protein
VVNRDYWSGEHPRPLTPDAEDVDVFRSYIGEDDTVLLLGNTRLLMPLCTAAMDTDPFIDDPRVIQQDWTTNATQYDVIIGDGVLNFTADLADALIQMASQHCRTFVARSFSTRLPIMRIADNFPIATDFAIAPNEVIERDLYRFYIWQFGQ